MEKKVYLRRKDIDGHLPKAVRAEAIMKLSSVFVNRQPLKPFSISDEKKYMEGILDVNPDHVDWPKHSKKFWAELTIPVGFTGVELEIGKNENGEPLIDGPNGKWPEGHPNHPWEAEAIAAEDQ